MSKNLLLFLFSLTSVAAMAQGESDSNLGSFMTWDLKIYVVLAVLFIILSFLLVFLFSMERRLKELEMKQKD